MDCFTTLLTGDGLWIKKQNGIQTPLSTDKKNGDWSESLKLLEKILKLK